MRIHHSAQVVMLMFSTFGCAGSIGDSDTELTSEEVAFLNATGPEGEQASANSAQALINNGTDLGAKPPWCAARKTCYDGCDRSYPGGGGPLATCKKICDKKVADKCRPAAVLF